MTRAEYAGESFRKMDLEDLRELVVDTVFSMAAGEGIPNWMRAAEAEFDRRIVQMEKEAGLVDATYC